MTVTIWFSLLAICLMGAMSPGPSLAMIAKHSLAGGRMNGLIAAWSHAAGILGIYAFATIVGLAVLLEQSPMIFKGISLAGAQRIHYLGVNALRSKGGVAAKLEAGEQMSYMQSAREAFLISILDLKSRCSLSLYLANLWR